MAKKTENTTKDNSWINCIGGKNPAAIEKQEAQGQEQFVASEQLPRQCNSPHGIKNVNELYHKMGIKTITPSKGDEGLFMGVQLPKGWKKVATDHAMWNKLLDEKGRERASIFYKAAAYDREAFININRRIHIRFDRTGFLNGDYSQDANHNYNSRNTPFCGLVEDYDGTVLFRTKEISCEGKYNPSIRGKNGGYTDKYKEESSAIEKKLKGECLTFVKEHYPN